MENIIKINLHLNFAGNLIVQKFIDSDFATAHIKGSSKNYFFKSNAQTKEQLKKDTLLFISKGYNK